MSPAELLRIAAGLDPEGLCAPPLGEQLAPVLPRLNGLIRAMSAHQGQVPVGRALLALAPRGRAELTGIEGDGSPWVRAFCVLGTASVFLIERAVSDPCHIVRLAVALNPNSSERALDQLASDGCTQVSALARHVLRRDRGPRGVTMVEPTAFLQRLRRCECSDDCGAVQAAPVEVIPVEVSEQALDILFRLVDRGRFDGTIRPTGCGIGPGWAFGVFESAVAGEPLLLVDHAGRVALPDAAQWHEFDVEAAVRWAAQQAGISLVGPVTPLRIAILVDHVASALGSAILQLAHLLTSNDVAATLRPFRVDGLAYEPHDPAHGVGATPHWLIEVAIRQRGGGLRGPTFLSEKQLFNLGSWGNDLSEFVRGIIEASDRPRAREDSTSSGEWRIDPMPLVIDRRLVTSLNAVEGGVIIESALDPEQRWHAFGSCFSSASDPDREPIIDVEGGSMCGFGLPRNLVLVAENGGELDARLAIGGSQGRASWEVSLEELPVSLRGIGTFIRTSAGWFIVREVLGEDGRWMSGYRQTLSRQVAVELAIFREMCGDVRVPEAESGRGGKSVAAERWRSADELVSFIGDPSEPFVTGLRYEFAIGGLIDAEQRGWAWTRCDADWRDCSSYDDGLVHGCHVPSDAMRRYVVQPWAFQDVVRIWDDSGRVPTALAVIAAQPIDGRLSASDLGVADTSLLRHLILGALNVDADGSEFGVLMRLAAGHADVPVEDAFREFVRLLEG